METRAGLILEEEDLQLRYQLVGKRLVCEVPFDHDLIARLRDALFNDPEEAWRFPHVAAVVTVGAGVYEYHSGYFWDSLPSLITVQQRTSWGRSFEAFLKQHPTLEAFSFLKEQGALRYVAPILAHGGVPESCLTDLFELITSRCSPDQTGPEAIEYFDDNRGALSGASRPVDRFISYGGEVAEELLGRILALWKALEAGDSKASLGLPKRIRTAFCDWYGEVAATLKTSRRHRFPSPAVCLDPRTMSITLRLPPCHRHPDSGDSWEALGRSWPTDLPNDAEMPIAPEAEWEVTCGRRVFHFRGVGEEQPAMFFDPSSGRIIRDPTRRRLPELVWALLREDAVPDPAPVHSEPFVQWPGFLIAAFDLEDHKRLVISGSEFDVRRPFFRLDNVSMRRDLVSRDSGVPVFARTPSIAWEGEANLTLTKDGHPQGNIEITSEDLPCLIGDPGEYRLNLRGPFGQNLQLGFLLLPGITVACSPSLAWPDTKFTEWSMAIPGGSVYRDGSEGEKFRCYGDSLDLEVVLGETRFPVLASAPRLEWRLNLGESERCGAWSQQPILLTEKELSHLAVTPILACRLPLDPDKCRVLMVGSSTDFRLDAEVLSVGDEAYCHFDLGIVRDRVLASGSAERFELVARGRDDGRDLFHGHILEVRPTWDLRGLRAEWALDDNTYVIRVDWSECGRPVGGRWLTMQPAWRPWDGYVRQQELQTGEGLHEEWPFPQEDLRPGRYRICAIHAPWGLGELASKEPQEECYLDLHKEAWPETYSADDSAIPVETYVEAILARSYRPELVPVPAVPQGLNSDDVGCIVKHLQMAHDIENIHFSSHSGEPLRVFCANPGATSSAVSNAIDLPDWLRRLLPPEDILVASLGPADREFLVELVWNWENIESPRTAAAVAGGAAPRKLCEPLRAWRRALRGTKKRASYPPPGGYVIFLCEKHRVIEDQSPAKESAYEKLKNEYFSEEYL
ncbi:MAG: hypothetical protein ACC742_08730 [Thermoanaerobaculales bacterium]